MAVYAYCYKCQCRRDAGKPGSKECGDKSSHKNYVGWVAFYHLAANGPRPYKIFSYKCKNPKGLAEAQERQWKTNYEQGLLGFKQKPTSVLFSTVADEWWTMVAIGQKRIKDPNRSEKSRFNKWKNKFDKEFVQDISFDDIEEWVASRIEDDIAVNTINRDLKPLRWILDYAVKKGYLPENPMKELKTLKGGNIHDVWMTEDQLAQLVQAAIDLGDRSLMDFIAVGVNTGFRLGNLERLTARDIDGDSLMARQTKSGVPYSVPIAPAIQPLIRHLVSQHPTGPLLPGRNNNIGMRFREAAKKAGLYKNSSDPDRVTIHTLRHTFAVLYLKRGGDIYKLSKLLGHANVGITDRIYARFCPKERLAQAPLISTDIPQLKLPELKVV